VRLAVTGKSGQVVSSLVERAPEDVEVVPVGRPEFDLATASPDGGLQLFRSIAPDVIVSAAAYTAVDKAESEPEVAGAINTAGAGTVADIAAALGVPVIHLSTDYVFDGRKTEPYTEEDPVAPLGVYGRTKLAGERAVADATENHVILRTAWVYSPYGNNFLKTMLRVGAEREEMRVVEDQRGNPTSALDIADAIFTVAAGLIRRADDPSLRGIFHLTGAGEGSWADFASEIFSIARDLGGPSAKVTRITSAEYPTQAERPANSRLSSEKIARAHGVEMPAWQQATRSVLERLLTSSRSA